MKKLKITKNKFDWHKELGVNAINRDSRTFTKVTDIWDKGIVIEVYEDLDEGEVSKKLSKRLWDGKDYEYTLYDDDMNLVGFAYWED